MTDFKNLEEKVSRFFEPMELFLKQKFQKNIFINGYRHPFISMQHCCHF
jgi:hypothetical protein